MKNFDINDMKAEFNRASDSLRILTLLSPT